MQKAVTGGLLQWEEGSLVRAGGGPSEGLEDGSSGAPQGVGESKGQGREGDEGLQGLSEQGVLRLHASGACAAGAWGGERPLKRRIQCSSLSARVRTEGCHRGPLRPRAQPYASRMDDAGPPEAQG